MKVLVIGGGGREHALVWKLAQSPQVTKLFCAPGNPGIAELAECIPIQDEDVSGLLRFAQSHAIDLTVVGPEKPLVLGIVDQFSQAGLAIFGPCLAAAQLEGSKGFAKRLMKKYGVPTAEAAEFSSFDAAWAYAQEKGGALVVKADGLAAGKGVAVCHSLEEVKEALERCFLKKEFGEAGAKVLLEEILVGEEASVLAFVDGKTVLPFQPAQDHKPVLDGDRGPNTGGMGAYSPVPLITPQLFQQVQTRILEPMVKGLTAEGILYRGILYAGLMITSAGPRVVEFNCRFGDPETQVVLPRMETDLVDLCMATVEGKLASVSVAWRKEAAVCVVLASQGYPSSYPKGFPIIGLERIKHVPDVWVFHAGTAVKRGGTVTAGGRVLGVTALAPDIVSAAKKSYQAIQSLYFEGMYYRTDIAGKALRLSEKPLPLPTSAS